MLGWFKKKLGKKKDTVEEQPVEEQLVEEKVQEEETVETAEPSSDTDIDNAAIETIEDEQPPEKPEPLLDPEPEPSENTEQDEVEEEQESEPEDEIEEEPVSAPAPQQAPGKKSNSLFKKLSDKLTRTRESFTYQLDTLFLGKKEIDADLLDELEEVLITADLGIGITQDLLEHARRKVKRNELSDPESLKNVLKDKIKNYILEHDKPAELVMPDDGPFIIMVVGVNGVGKTTSIGKIAHKFINSGQSVLLVAGDTFRAAAVSQLTIWAERNGVDIVSKEGADPSAVAFDAMDIAKSGKYDVVLVDTAGRLHTQTNLMDELKKIKRVISKQIKGAPHEVMLVIDATTGQNGVSQAKLFDAAVDITGLTLTKLDGTAKGGIVANIAREMKTPIRFIGIGEQVEDLRDFNADDFIEALFQKKQ